MVNKKEIGRDEERKERTRKEVSLNHQLTNIYFGMVICASQKRISHNYPIKRQISNSQVTLCILSECTLFMVNQVKIYNIIYHLSLHCSFISFQEVVSTFEIDKCGNLVVFLTWDLVVILLQGLFIDEFLLLTEGESAYLKHVKDEI